VFNCVKLLVHQLVFNCEKLLVHQLVFKCVKLQIDMVKFASLHAFLHGRQIVQRIKAQFVCQLVCKIDDMIFACLQAFFYDNRRIFVHICIVKSEKTEHT
jgi:hypothetical protein